MILLNLFEAINKVVPIANQDDVLIIYSHMKEKWDTIIMIHAFKDSKMSEDQAIYYIKQWLPSVLAKMIYDIENVLKTVRRSELYVIYEEEC